MTQQFDRADRRQLLRAGVAAAAALVLPSCKNREAESPSKQNDGVRAVADHIATLPSIDPKVGAKVAEAVIPQAESLLVVVRFGHTTTEALQEAGPVAKKLLLESYPQAGHMLKTLARHFELKSLMMDGLTPSGANNLNENIRFLKSETKSLGVLAKYRSLDEIVRDCDKKIGSLDAKNPERIQAESLKRLIKSNPEGLDNRLKQYAEIKSHIEGEAAGCVAVKVAYELDLTVTATEDPKLVEQAIALAEDPDKLPDLIRLNEKREDAILDSVAGARVTLIAMGAMHRFTENALARSEGPAKSRVSVVEYNPQAFPNELSDLIAEMEK